MITLLQDQDIHIIHATTGELIRQLTLAPTKDYQPQNKKSPAPGSGLSYVLRQDIGAPRGVWFQDIVNSEQIRAVDQGRHDPVICLIHNPNTTVIANDDPVIAEFTLNTTQSYRRKQLSPRDRGFGRSRS